MFAMTKNSIMSGAILLWSGSVASIPSGWVLCDGTNDTPDLRNLFVIGAGDTYDPADTGGQVLHNHSIGTQATGTPSANTEVVQGSEEGTDVPTTTHTHNFSGVTANAGYLPPYYALAYIMKT